MSLLSRLLGPRRRTAALEERAREHMQVGELVAARTLVEEALSLAPREAAVHSLSGRLALLEGRLDVAVAHLQTACAADTGSAALRCDFGEALRLSGRPAEALDAFRAALHLVPDFPQALLGLAESLADAGDVAAARDALARAKCLPPERLIQIRRRADALAARLSSRGLARD